MQPRDLKPENFKAYPPEARKLATEYAGSLQRLPLSFLPSLLREVIDYDFKFPAERKSLERELGNWNALPEEKGKEWVSGFAQISLSPQLEQFDWVNQPAQFVDDSSDGCFSQGGVGLWRSFAGRRAAGSAANDQAWNYSDRSKSRGARPASFSKASTPGGIFQSNQTGKRDT